MVVATTTGGIPLQKVTEDVEFSPRNAVTIGRTFRFGCRHVSRLPHVQCDPEARAVLQPPIFDIAQPRMSAVYIQYIRVHSLPAAKTTRYRSSN